VTFLLGAPCINLLTYLLTLTYVCVLGLGAGGCDRPAWLRGCQGARLRRRRNTPVRLQTSQVRRERRPALLSLPDRGRYDEVELEQHGPRSTLEVRPTALPRPQTLYVGPLYLPEDGDDSAHTANLGRPCRTPCRASTQLITLQ